MFTATTITDITYTLLSLTKEMESKPIKFSLSYLESFDRWKNVKISIFFIYTSV